MHTYVEASLLAIGRGDIDSVANSAHRAVLSGIEWNHCEVLSLKVVCTIDWRNPRQSPALKESPMPWYAWLILVVAIGSIVGGLMLLRDTATKVDLTEEQRKRVAERNAEMDAKEAQDR
jgi:hypothetical protein